MTRRGSDNGESGDELGEALTEHQLFVPAERSILDTDYVMLAADGQRPYRKQPAHA